jgi:osmotically-inducible protein OsmY
MNKSLLVLLSIALLNACTTTAPLTQQQQESDAKLKEAVINKYKSDKMHFLDHVDIQVYKGIVNLTGEVFTFDDEDAAYNDAREVAGPANVTGAITVSYVGG